MISSWCSVALIGRVQHSIFTSCWTRPVCRISSLGILGRCGHLSGRDRLSYFVQSGLAGWNACKGQPDEKQCSDRRAGRRRRRTSPGSVCTLGPSPPAQLKVRPRLAGLCLAPAHVSPRRPPSLNSLFDLASSPPALHGVFQTSS